MVFDSTAFMIFFAAFFAFYHLLYRWLNAQNVLILAGSYLFYGWWDWRFLGLLTLSAGVDYIAGLAMSTLDGARQRKLILMLSLATNLIILFTFKYFDFFATSLQAALSSLGIHASLPLLNVVLPVGISFYTFQSMAYTIDVYRRDIPAERNPLVYFCFVSFFPQLVAGPIERAGHMIGQMRAPRELTADKVKEAVWLLSWGYFLKEVIADTAATFADEAFRVDQTSGWMTILGTLAFSLQIYCDFNAYSCIARGTAKLLGFELVWNFRLPYFATSIQDFWRRWHISLSSWLRDYLYISLGGNRKGPRRTYVNLILTMLLGGLWHGAAWNFVLWGLLHGFALAVNRAFTASGRSMHSIPGWMLTMMIVLLGWLLFRCTSWEMLKAMTLALGDLAWTERHGEILSSLIILTGPVALIEAWQRWRDDLLAPLRLDVWRLAALNAVLLTASYAMFDRFHYAFIYFQF